MSALRHKELTGGEVLRTLGGLFLFAFSPFIPVVIAGMIASLTGSVLNEADIHPCVILGVDIGGLLCAMGMCGWFGLITIPCAFFAAIVFTVIWVIRGSHEGEPAPQRDQSAASDPPDISRRAFFRGGH